MAATSVFFRTVVSEEISNQIPTTIVLGSLWSLFASMLALWGPVLRRFCHFGIPFGTFWAPSWAFGGPVLLPL